MPDSPTALKPLDHTWAEAFAHRWIAAWNAHDVDTVLAKFTDDVEFRSPKAAAISGKGTLRGKPALAAYWREALSRIGNLHFEFESLVWDAKSATLVIRYVAELGAQRVIAAEILDFDAQGQAFRGTALYGSAVD